MTRPIRSKKISKQLKLVGIDYGVTTGLAIVNPESPFDVEYTAILRPQPQEDFSEVVREHVRDTAGCVGDLVVVMEVWPDGSPMHNGFYLQALQAVNDLGPTKFVQVKPVQWKQSSFIRNNRMKHLSVHVADAINMARWQANRTTQEEA